VREGAASAIQRDQYRQAAMASRAALVAREADLAFRTVRAPQAGVIGEINLKPGDVLQAGVPFTRLVSNSDQLAEIELPANLAGRIRPGLPVLLQAPGGSGQEIRTRISAVDPSVMTTTQLLMAQAPLPVGGEQWRNGMRLRARVVLGSRRALAVPFAAVTRLAGQSFVYVIGNRGQLLQRPGQVDRQQLTALPAQTLFALQVPVQLGEVQNNRYPVLAGLSPGQRVITSGLLTLRHGTPVRPRQDRSPNFR
jgi:RND family efflux transporter MFP subunit